MNIGTYGKIAITGSFLLVGSNLFAQKGFEFGIRYEIQKSMLINKSDKDAGSDLSRTSTWSYANAGIGITYNFNSMMGVEIDVLRSRQGQSYMSTNPTANGTTKSYEKQVVLQSIFNGETTVGDHQAKAELNCTKIPLLFKWSTNNTRPLSFHVALGPQINMISSVVYELNTKDIELDGTNMKQDDAYKKVTFDGVISPGVTYNITRHFNIAADLRFDYGFQDVEKKDVTYTYATLGPIKYYGDGRASTHNMTMGLMIGINYKL